MLPDTPSASQGRFSRNSPVRVRHRPRPPGPPREVRSRRRARIPRMPWQGRRAASPARGDRESVFPPARPHSAGSGESGAECASATAVAGSAPPATVSGESASRLVAAVTGYSFSPLAIAALISSSATTVPAFSCLAKSKGVQPSLSFALTSAPLAISSFATSAAL